MEQFLVLVLLVLAAVVNVLMRWARQRAAPPARDSEPEHPRPAERRARPPAEPARADAARPELPVAASRRPPPPGPAPPARPWQPVHSRLGRPADIRRAIVVMTLLAPCRALEEDSEATVPTRRH
jgi:hypothetical protein